MRNIEAETMPIGSISEQECQLFCEWMWRQKESSNFDPQVLAAPRACMMRATHEGKTIAFMPLQPVIALESLCNDASLTKSQITLVVYEIHKLLKKIMQDSGTNEAFFTTSNDTFAHLCEGQGWKRHLYDEKKNTWLMKLQIGQPCES